MKRKLSTSALLILCSMLSQAGFAATPGLYAAAAGDRCKIKVENTATAQQIVQAGGRLVADYGGFAVLEVNQLGVQKLSAVSGVEPLEGQDHILLNAGTIDTSARTVPAARRAPSAFAGKRLHLVQFAGPVKPEWCAELTASGARIVTYIPHNAYLVYVDAAGLARLQANRQDRAYIQWEGAYTTFDRIQPGARTTDSQGRVRSIGTELFAIQLVADPEANAATLALVDRLKLAPVRSLHENQVLQYLNVVVALPAAHLEEIAAQPDVVSIHPYFPPQRRCERQAQIVAGNLNPAGSQPTGPGYYAWLLSKGFTQAQFDSSGFIVDIADDGWDNGVAASPANREFRKFGEAAQASRVKYSRNGSTLSAAASHGADGHGNINISIVGGFSTNAGSPFVDAAGYHRGQGICPFANLGNTKVFEDGGSWGPSEAQEAAFIASNYASGVRISSDSWGMPGDGAYDVNSQNYDTWTRDSQPAVAGNQQVLYVFAAGNDGSGSSTIGAPGTGKNICSVGAAENYNLFGTDGCSVSDAGADNANDIIDFSSRGPCTDQRKKPDIMAPGTHVQGAASFYSGYTGDGVCDKYQPAGQTNYAASSGTSHSTPAVAGGAALVYQYFINQAWTVPSPAMIKAYLMNSTRYMTGVDANDTLPSNHQGMGAMNLGRAFDGVARILRDQLTNDLFTATGQSRKFYGLVADTNQPLRITLSWTDAPGGTSGNAYKNNLDLVVLVGGVSYKGNVFSGAYSTNGGSADLRNNVESVFLPAGRTGLVQVTVNAVNINSDGVPGYGTTVDQDFALVVANAIAFTPSNYPPVLEPIGNKTISTNRLLQFTVTASDPVDADTVALWATGLPPWATFAGATNAGSVSCLFAGTPMETGTYAVTFYAADKDGTNSESITVIANDINCVPTNIIDEGFAGGTTPPAGWTFTGIGGTYTTAGNYGRASPSLKFDASGDRIETPALNMPTNLQFWIKGQTADANSALLVEGYNGSTWSTVANLVPLANTAVTQRMDLAEGFIQLRFTYTKSVGNLAFDDVIIGGCSGSAPQTNRHPVINVAGGTNQYVEVNTELSFVVTVNDADAENVGVFTNAAPAGAHFPDALGIAPIQSTFTWTPGTTGVFTASFVAFDAKVTVTQDVRIVVSEPAQPLDPPVIQAATAVQTFQFNANWLASAGATGYRLDVATNSSFSGGGTVTTNLSEDFSLFIRTNSATDISGSLDTYMHTAGWTGAKIYEDVGTAKLGSSSAKGIITTPTVDLSANGGVATVNFDLQKYSTDIGLVQVLHAADGATFAQVGTDITPPDSVTRQTVAITGGTASSKIRIQAKGLSKNRFYLDNFAITQAAPARRYVPGYENLDVGDVTTYAVTGLVQQYTYYYRVRAYNATSNSAYSAVTNVVTLGATNMPPAFTAPASTNQSVVASNALSFLVSATTAPDADDVTLWAENVPGWATFGTFTSNMTVSGQFAGTPLESQTNLVTFYAGDKDGTNARTVRIVVSGAQGGDELLPPVIQPASLVQANQFNANWLASANATGYLLDVATNADFSSGGGENLVVNPGFETGDNTGWSTFESGYSVVTESPHAGAYCVQCVAGSTRDLAQNVTVPPTDGSTAFEISYWYRVTAGDGSDVRIWASWNNGQGSGSTLQPTNYNPNVSAWTRIVLTNTPAAGATNFHFEVRCYTGATVYMDDFSVVRLGGAGRRYVPGYQSRDVGHVTTYAVTGLVENLTYYYRVKAYNVSSNSAYSAVTSIVTVAASDYEDWANGEGLDPHGPNGGQLDDYDNDSLLNIEEKITGTHPTNPFSFFMLEEMAQAPAADCVFTFNGLTGRVYAIEYSTNLLPPQAWLLQREVTTPVDGPVDISETNDWLGAIFRIRARMAP